MLTVLPDDGLKSFSHSATVGFFETFNEGVICILLPMRLIPALKQLDFLLSCVSDMVILDLVYLRLRDLIHPSKCFNLIYSHLFSNNWEVFTQVIISEIHWHIFRF